MFRIDRSSVKIQEASEVALEAKRSFTEEMAAELANEQAQMVAQSVLREYKVKGERLITEAYEKSEDIRRAASMAAEELKATAYRTGLAEGRAEAESEIAGQLKEGAAMISRLILGIEQERDKMFASIEGDVVELTLAIVKKIFNTSLKLEYKVFESMIKKALQQMKWEGKITIRVSSEEYERFFSSGSATFVLGDESVSTTIAEDPNMQSGDCVIESEGETINAGFSSQLKFITLAFHQKDEAEPEE